MTCMRNLKREGREVADNVKALRGSRADVGIGYVVEDTTKCDISEVVTPLLSVSEVTFGPRGGLIRLVRKSAIPINLTNARGESW